MPAIRRTKKLLKLLLFSLLGLATVILLLPLWLPWMLRPLAAANHIHYQSCFRQGYAAFRFTGLAFTNSSIRLTVAELQAPQPLAWLWHVKAALPASAQRSAPFLQVNGWNLSLLPSEENSRRAPTSTVTNIDHVIRIARALQTWVPDATLARGTVSIQTATFRIPDARWSRGVLTAAVQPQAIGHMAAPLANFSPGVSRTDELRFDLAVDCRPARSASLLIASPQLGLRVPIEISLTPPGANAVGAVLWRSNRLDFQSHFFRAGLLPDSLSLRATDMLIPSAAIGLQDWQDLRGSLEANWLSNRFNLTLNALAEPQPTLSNLPPVSVQLAASGDTNSASLEAFAISAPWLTASLAHEVQVRFHSPFISEPADLRVDLDLARQTWTPLSGRLSGLLHVLPPSNAGPDLTFEILGTNVGTAALRADSLALTGLLHYPELRLRNASARFTDGSSATLAGAIDLKFKNVSDAAVTFSGPLPNRWLPRGCSLLGLALEAKASGPITNLAHSGQLQISGFSAPQLKPLSLRAAWIGRQIVLPSFIAELTSTNAALALAGSVDLRDDSLRVALTNLTAATNGQLALALHETSAVFVSLKKPFSASLNSLDWAGPAGRLRLHGAIEWPRVGSAQLTLENINSSLLAPWLAASQNPDFKSDPAEPFAAAKAIQAFGLEIEHLNTDLAWSNSPLAASVELAARATTPKNTNYPGLAQRQLSLNLHLATSSSGLAISNLSLAAESKPVFSLTGIIPLVISPNPQPSIATPTAASVTGTSNLELRTSNLGLIVVPHSPLQLSIRTDSHSALWQELPALTGYSLVNPALRADVTGTLAAPTGSVVFSAAQLAFPKDTTNGPAIADLSVNLQFDSQKVTLALARLTVQDQPVTISGSLPLGEPFWLALRSRKTPPLEQASAHLRIPQAQIASFSHFFPSLLAPEGKLDLDLSLRPGRQLNGQFRLLGASLRPLPDIGPLRDIQCLLKFDNRLALLQNVSGELGGARVSLQGELDVLNSDWWPEHFPPARISIHGANVPLARQPELILRSDLNLDLTKTNGAPPLLAGTVNLRNSVLLRDLRDFAQGKLASGPPRAPYFSIQEPALAPWRLLVHVVGEDFMKIRTPVFVGSASANLRLQGTLKDPVAIGDLRLTSGTVQFPFANLQVVNGFVNVSPQDPARPTLNVRAGAKQFGYDIRMDASGPVDAPIIQFSSNPPLSSQRILLMITAGELPGSEQVVGSQQRAQAFAVYLGRDLLSKLGLLSDADQRLTVQSGEQLSETGRPTYLLEYKLSNHWSLTGEYDRFNDFNVGAKWRFYSK